MVLDTSDTINGASNRQSPPTAGPPTAPTTSTVDGEDPPSSEDYINDFHPDEQP